MRKWLRKIGLITDFELLFPIDNDKVVQLLTSDKNDVKVDIYHKIFGSEIPFNSIDFKFDSNQKEFEIIRESKINPRKGRAKIKFRIEPFEKNETRIKGMMESNYSDLIFPIISYCIFIGIITITIILSDNYGIEWIIYITGFFFIVMSFIILFQKFEIRNVKKALITYFERIK